MINKGSSRFSYFLAAPPLLSFENPNYFCEWGRWQEGRKDYVTFSCRITPDACFSLCLQVSDPTSVSLEPLPATGKGGRQEGERGGRRGGRAREREREECSLEIRRWKWTAGINNLSNDAAPVSESIFTSSLIPKRHSQTMVALEARA